MSSKPTKSKKVLTVMSACLLGTVTLALPQATAADAKPQIIRGIPSQSQSQLQLAYLATFPGGSLEPALDK